MGTVTVRMSCERESAVGTVTGCHVRESAVGTVTGCHVRERVLWVQ